MIYFISMISVIIVITVLGSMWFSLKETSKQKKLLWHVQHHQEPKLPRDATIRQQQLIISNLQAEIEELKYDIRT